MTTPFSMTGLHSIAFSGLLNAAQQIGYTDEGDVYDHLKNGSEESYVKPLHYHVHDSIIIQITILNFMLGLSKTWACSSIGSFRALFIASFSHQAGQD